MLGYPWLREAHGGFCFVGSWGRSSKGSNVGYQQYVISYGGQNKMSRQFVNKNLTELQPVCCSPHVGKVAET